MSSHTPLLQETIEPDELPVPSGRINSSNNVPRAPVVLTPTTRAQAQAAPGDLEAGLSGILKQSSHPLSLLFLYFFRIAAITVYVLCGFFTENFVLSTVIVVVLLAMDFWNCRNVSGRTLVGLRYWNQVDDDGESYWVFESRDPSRPANAIDSRYASTALYVFPVLWFLLLVVSILKFNISFLPIVALALVFNITNVIGFTYADRDAKERWAHAVGGDGWNIGLGGLGGQIMGSMVKQSVGRVFGR
ncbi:DUF846-domain-containing protein [Sistotremastrum niveocremeum HHB9708]|uniref:Golgi apparatus membrane protein TVP23 n=1 Tax=Sistotremastrum niveocremeum HHB9708 TaxID=1314777 RepID=A0A164XFC9_9AGAM|nr:DUF846-domain-containing protein [Sistotremastrum niveocremeum HHB9708]